VSTYGKAVDPFVRDKGVTTEVDIPSLEK